MRDDPYFTKAFKEIRRSPFYWLYRLEMKVGVWLYKWFKIDIYK